MRETPSILRSLSAAKGVKGSNATARSAHTCSERLSIVAVRSISVLATFQGSVSEMYLLPARAIDIASFRASRKWYPSRFLSMEALSTGICESSSLSTSSSVPHGGTLPAKYLCVSTTALFTKLPNTATSSLLLRCWKSFQLKSLSLVSGAFAVST